MEHIHCCFVYFQEDTVENLQKVNSEYKKDVSRRRQVGRDKFQALTHTVGEYYTKSLRAYLFVGYEIMFLAQMSGICCLAFWRDKISQHTLYPTAAQDMKTHEMGRIHIPSIRLCNEMTYLPLVVHKATIQEKMFTNGVLVSYNLLRTVLLKLCHTRTDTAPGPDIWHGTST